ncbi:MAG: RidA family protein [Bacillota bacterium]|jgi:2-iminobutanoate/2-iminopropanoate deaminase
MKQPIASELAPAAVGPYSQAVKTGNLLFVSGTLPIDPKTGELAPGGIEGQTRMVFENMRCVLAAAGADFSNLVKTTVYLADIADFAAMNAIYAEYVPSPFPARAAFQVSALPKGAMVEIEAVVELS